MWGRVEKALRGVPGVATTSVNLATERADVSFSGAPDPMVLVRAIEQAGYEAPTEATEFAVKGMRAVPHVSGRIEKALKAVPGVLEANVNLATEKASVRSIAGYFGSRGRCACFSSFSSAPPSSSASR